MLSELESKIENSVMRAISKLPAVVGPMYVLKFFTQKLGDLASAWVRVLPSRWRKVINYNLYMYVCKKSDKGIRPRKSSNNGNIQRRGWRKGL